jgi:hypothetical protein
MLCGASCKKSELKAISDHEFSGLSYRHPHHVSGHRFPALDD